MKNRKEVLNEIDRILTQHCKSCVMRVKGGYNERSKKRKNVSQFSVDVYCATDCPIGTELQKLGENLESISREKRKSRRMREQKDLLTQIS